jgi:hypothetical protein
MERRAFFGAVLTVGLLVAATASARCFDDPADFGKVADTRVQAEMVCPCASATSHGDYRQCVAGVVSAAVASEALPPQCARNVKTCALRSICGRPGAVPCCRTNARGVTRCTIKRDASRCTAPRGGTACVSGLQSCCDACTKSGCIPTATPTITPTFTVTPTPTVPPFCVPMVGSPTNAQVPVTLAQGSPSCGPPAVAPFSGQVLDGTGAQLGQLGLGCLYTGGLPALTIPDGATAVAQVTGISGATITLGGSNGSGVRDCTKGSGPTSSCLNGAPGTDGHGACLKDSDCGHGAACAPTEHCFFGAPIPVPLDIFSVCVVNGFLADLCGSVDLTTQASTFATALTSGVYLTQNPTSPCPKCVGGTCDSGPNAGQACVGVGSLQTTLDCPPDPSTFLTRLTVVVPQLTSGTATLVADSTGKFCPNQPDVGALGFPDARQIVETGMGLTPNLNAIGTFQEALAAVFCVPKTNNPLIDNIGKFPAAGALSAAATVDLSQALPLP